MKVAAIAAWDRFNAVTTKMTIVLAVMVIVMGATGSPWFSLTFTALSAVAILYYTRDYYFEDDDWFSIVISGSACLFYWGCKWIPDLLNYLTYLRVSGSI